jgi:hypothetical protein
MDMPVTHTHCCCWTRRWQRLQGAQHVGFAEWARTAPLEPCTGTIKGSMQQDSGHAQSAIAAMHPAPVHVLLHVPHARLTMHMRDAVNQHFGLMLAVSTAALCTAFR